MSELPESAVRMVDNSSWAVYKGLGHARPVVERREPGAIVGRPPGAGGAAGKAPGVHQTGIGDGGEPGHIGHQVGLLVVAGNIRRKAQRATQAEHEKQAEGDRTRSKPEARNVQRILGGAGPQAGHARHNDSLVFPRLSAGVLLWQRLMIWKKVEQ